jgi:hypothetical protein
MNTSISWAFDMRIFSMEHIQLDEGSRCHDGGRFFFIRHCSVFIEPVSSPFLSHCFLLVDESETSNR